MSAALITEITASVVAVLGAVTALIGVWRHANGPNHQ